MRSPATELRAGIVGCGLIGRKRAAAFPGRISICADLDPDRATSLASEYGAAATNQWQKVLDDAAVDLVFVATRHDSLAAITRAAVEAGKHVLVEKPGARSAAELEAVAAAARGRARRVRVGFNHRFHPAIQKARSLIDDGAIGELMFLRARYGHGGRVGYDREWRANPALSGGGELIDQGVHLIDLSRWFLGPFAAIDGAAHTYYWDMPVDDNAFLLLRTAAGKTAFLHASCTEWKNLFSLEIYGREGKLDIAGLGGSYGVERIAYYKMRPEMGPPDTTILEYPRGDSSWVLEIRAFLEDIECNRDPEPGLGDAIEVLKVVQEIYRQSNYDHHS
jgi:predicted dehydrogenase